MSGAAPWDGAPDGCRRRAPLDSLANERQETRVSEDMNPIERWHQILASRNARALDELLADDVVFHSPVVNTPQAGKPITRMYLSAALLVLANDTFRYVREVVGERDAALEFVTDI